MATTVSGRTGLRLFVRMLERAFAVLLRLGAASEQNLLYVPKTNKKCPMNSGAITLAFATFLIASLPRMANADVTYNYTSNTLTLTRIAPDGFNCPLLSGTLTATVVIDEPVLNGTAIVKSGTLSALGYSLPIQTGPNNPTPYLYFQNGTVVGNYLWGNFSWTSTTSVEDLIGSVFYYGQPNTYNGDALNLSFNPNGGGPYGVCTYQSIILGKWTQNQLADGSNLGNGGGGGGTTSPAGGDPNAGCGATPRCIGGNPINAATGNKFQIETDFAADPHTAIALTRYYNSQDTTASAFGQAWHSTWHHGLIVNGNAVTVTRADGRQDVFTNSGPGVYTANPDVTDRLSPVPATGTQTGWELLRADDSIEVYTLGGLLSSITSRAGLVTNLAYDGNNRLIRVTGPFGHTLNFVNDNNGRVSQMTAPDGGIYSYNYSSSGNLTSVTYPSGAQRQYLYENTSFPNALTGIIDENGQRFATWTYDSQGRAVSSQHAGGAELTTIAYNSDGSSSVTDANGNQHTYNLTTQFGVVKPVGLSGAPVPSAGGKAFTYDANGFLASRTDYDGNVSTYTHDTRGNETSRVMASGTPQARTIATAWDATFNLPTQIIDGSRTFSFAYDPNGNLLSRTLAASGNSSTWSYTYNSAGQVVTATDPAGNVTSYAYDTMGNLVRITNALGQVTRLASYDANGRLLKMQDPNGLVTTLTYNFRGQVTSKTEGQWVIAYTYDAAGQLIRLTRPDSSFLAFTYDPAHRLVGIADALGNRIAYTLDAASNRVQEQVFAASGTLFRTRSYTYDWVNRVSQAIGALGQATSYSYDPNGNLTQIIDPLGHATTEIYDPLNRMIGTTDANGGVTTFSYDALSRLASVTDPRGLVTSYGYDGLNDVISTNSPDTGVSAKTYDAAGNVLTSTDARGQTTAYTYDALNRVTQAAFADGTAVTYQYDQGANGIGHLTAMTDPGGTTTWTYNNHGRVTSKSQIIGGVTLTTNQTYNAVTGQRANLTYPSGSVLIFSYDANGQVSGVNHRPPNGGARTLLSKIAYQPFGPASSWLTGNGASYSRTFDQDGRVAQLVLPSGNTSTVAYDAASRITNIAETALPTKAFGYDALNRIVTYAGGADAQTYAYDASGNRTGFTEKLPPLVDAALTYSYDKASNRLLGIGGSWTESFAYDANGNTVSHTSPVAKYTYAYDARNRRTQTFVGAVPTTDVLNGLGQRTAQTHRGVLENFVYDEDGHLSGSYNQTNGTSDETVWLGDLPVAVLSAGGAQRYIAPDHLGAPHEITNPAAQVVWQWDHDPFGNGQPSGTFNYGLRFPGQFYDRTTGLYYNYFRDYDPRTGRYIESDPIGLKGGINTYAYVADNPVNDWDMNGLAPGGPYHPPEGTSLRCTIDDSCLMLSGKMWVLMRMIVSHQLWDWINPPPRGGDRHAQEIADLWRAYANCQALHDAMCGGNCPPSGPSTAPVPVPPPPWLLLLPG